MFHRPIKLSDIGVIDAIWRKHHADHFGLPSLNNVLVQRIVENDNHEVIGFGMVKFLGELILVLDLDRPMRERAYALHTLMGTAIEMAKKSNLEQLHAFIQDPKFSEVMRNHYSLIPIKGEALVINLGA